MTLRQIYKVFAIQIVVSESNPQGVLSDISGYPKSFDSRNYKATTENPNGDPDIALLQAQADYSTEIASLANADSTNRVGWAVSIIRGSDGKQIANRAWGGFPDMTPAPEPKPEEPVEEHDNAEAV